MFGFGKKEEETTPAMIPRVPVVEPTTTPPVAAVVVDEPFVAVRGGDADAPVVNATGFLTENIPGKIVLNAGQIEQQKIGLAKLEKKYAAQSEEKFNEKEALVGWTKQAEMYVERASSEATSVLLLFRSRNDAFC